MLSEYKGTGCCNPRKAVTVTAANWAKEAFFFLQNIFFLNFLLCYFIYYLFFGTESLYYVVLTT